MNSKYFLFLLGVCSIFLGIILLSSEETPLKVITSPKVYSMKHTELNESFTISVLMNKNNTFHLDQTYVTKSSIINGENQIPIEIEKVEVSSNKMEIDEEGFYLVNYIVSMKFNSNDHLINFEEAYLQLEYQNEELLELYIGELNYVFKDNTGDLSLYNLQGTFGEVNGINTVTGVAIELKNKANQNIIIKRVDVLSSDVKFNNDYLVEKDRQIDMFESVSDILLLHTYDFGSYESTESHHPIYEGTMKKFYVPMIYNDEIKYISRFVIVVTYEKDGSEYQYYIDDFIFMNTLNFGPEYQDQYVVYDYEDN